MSLTDCKLFFTSKQLLQVYSFSKTEQWYIVFLVKFIIYHYSFSFSSCEIIASYVKTGATPKGSSQWYCYDCHVNFQSTWPCWRWCNVSLLFIYISVSFLYKKSSFVTYFGSIPICLRSRETFISTNFIK